MFNRPAKTDEPARAKARGGTKLASLITEDLTIDGDITGGGELHVDCVIRGDVSVSQLSLGASGRIEGAVKAESADLRGWVIGSISAQQVHLHASAHVEGDISHDQLTIEPGAHFEGRSIRFQSAVPSLPSLSPPDKA